LPHPASSETVRLIDHDSVFIGYSELLRAAGFGQMSGKEILAPPQPAALCRSSHIGSCIR
jgi:hypothetical protein